MNQMIYSQRRIRNWHALCQHVDKVGTCVYRWLHLDLMCLCHMEINLAQALLIVGINNQPYTIQPVTKETCSRMEPESSSTTQPSPAPLPPFQPLLSLKLNTVTNHLWREQLPTALRNLGSSLHNIPAPNPGTTPSFGSTEWEKSSKNCYVWIFSNQ
jgi:hypothetical protein